MNEKIGRILRHPATPVVGVGMMGAGVGFIVGYILGRRKTYGSHVIPEPMDFDMASEIRNYETRTYEKPEIVEKGTVSTATSDTVRAFLDDRLKSQGRGEVIEPLPQPEVEEEEVVRRSIFAEDGDGWDYELEVANRRDTEPYVLHKDEYFENERDYTQSTITYYAGDNIMADEADVPIYNYESKVGELKFGHGSGDPNVFYARNTKLKIEYEVLLHSGQFAVEVAGLDAEQSERAKDLKHSGIKFRQE